MRVHRKTRWVLLLAVLAVVAAGLARALQQLHKPQRGIPTAVVKRGRLDMKVYTDGELHARRSVMIVAPSVSGNLRIIRLAPTGAHVPPGDVVVEFDPSEQQYNLQENRFDLEEAEQEIAKAKADAAVQAAKDEVELLKAKFDVRRAELDVSKNELVSAIDAKKNLLASVYEIFGPATGRQAEARPSRLARGGRNPLPVRLSVGIPRSVHRVARLSAVSRNVYTKLPESV